MLNSIMSSILTYIGGLLEQVVTFFLSGFSLSLKELVEYFPFLVIGYRIFQYIALGIILAIGTVGFIRLAGAGLKSKSEAESPWRLAFGALIAAALVFFGNYFFEMMIDLISTPFQEMMEANAVTSMKNALTTADSASKINWGAPIGAAIGNGTILLGCIILVALITFNLLKLMVEVCERYVILGVIVFASPLAFATVTSETTEDIFKKYIKLFIGQGILMVLSIWSIKLVLSGFSISPGTPNVFFRLLFTLAMCKVAQRIDTYMAQLGIGTVTTGGSLLSEAVGTAMMIGSIGRRSFAGATSPKNMPNDNGQSLSRLGGVAGGISNAYQRAKMDYATGLSPAQIAQNARKNFRVGAGYNGIVENIKAKKAGEKVTAGQWVTAGADGMMAGGILTRGSVARENQRQATIREKNAVKKAPPVAYTDKATLSSMSDEKRAQFKRDNPDVPVAEACERNYNANGHGSVVEINTQEGGQQLAVDEIAQEAGISLADNSESKRAEYDSYVAGFTPDPDAPNDAPLPFEETHFAEEVNPICGPAPAVGGLVADMYNDTGDEVLTRMREDVVRNTVNCNGAVAENAFFGSDKPLSGHDAMGAPMAQSAFKNLPGHDHREISASSDKSGIRSLNTTYTDDKGYTKNMTIYRDADLARADRPVNTLTQSGKGISNNIIALEGASGERYTGIIYTPDLPQDNTYRNKKTSQTASDIFSKRDIPDHPASEGIRQSMQDNMRTE